MIGDTSIHKHENAQRYLITVVGIDKDSKAQDIRKQINAILKRDQNIDIHDAGSKQLKAYIKLESSQFEMNSLWQKCLRKGQVSTDIGLLKISAQKIEKCAANICLQKQDNQDNKQEGYTWLKYLITLCASLIILFVTISNRHYFPSIQDLADRSQFLTQNTGTRILIDLSTPQQEIYEVYIPFDYQQSLGIPRSFIQPVQNAQIQAMLQYQHQKYKNYNDLIHAKYSEKGEVLSVQYQSKYKNVITDQQPINEQVNSQKQKRLKEELQKQEQLRQQKYEQNKILLMTDQKISLKVDTEDYIEFEIKGQTYSLQRKIKPSVTDISQTLKPNSQYIRPTVTEIFTFPSVEGQQTMRDKQKLEFTLSQDDLMLHSFRLSTRQKASNREYKFYIEMMKNPQYHRNLELQYFHLNKFYDLDQKRKELMMCVVSTGRNLFFDDDYKFLFTSLSRQNYTNFKIYNVDDDSEDNTTLRLAKYIQDNFPQIRSKVYLLRNQNRVGAFANKDATIKENCPQDSIVIDIDSDDGLIGNQVFNTLNAVYQSDQMPWVVYSNFIINKKNQKFTKGFSEKLKVPIEQYRTNPDVNFHTSHLKTYLAKLQNKIPIDYLTYSRPTQTDSSVNQIKYQKYSSDSSMMYSLIELAGKQKISYLPNFFYQYTRKDEFISECHHFHQRWDNAKARKKIPLAPLQEIDGEVKFLQTFDAFPEKEFLQRRYDYLSYCNLEGIEQLKEKLGPDAKISPSWAETVFKSEK